jgi:hypothetical protein
MNMIPVIKLSRNQEVFRPATTAWFLKAVAEFPTTETCFSVE